jgi:hypothetical protein
MGSLAALWTVEILVGVGSQNYENIERLPSKDRSNDKDS